MEISKTPLPTTLIDDKVPVDIKTLIQTSTIQIYDKTELIKKLEDHFSEEEQKLYVSNLFLYLNYHPVDDFVVNLENVWKFIGFSNKANGKRLLKQHFTENRDYKLIFIRSDENKTLLIRSDEQKKDNRGRKEETIMLNINTFKKLCLKSNTDKADKIHDYYIKLEMVYNELMKEQLESQKTLIKEKDSQLKEKDNQLKEKDSRYLIKSKLDKHQFLIEKFTSKKCIYLAEIEDDKIKIGSTNDINLRKDNLKKVFGKCSFTDFFECKYYREVEQNILVTVRQHLYKVKINNHISKEVVHLSDTFNYNQLVRTVKEEIDKYEKYMFWKESNDSSSFNSELLDLLRENNKILKNIQNNLIKNTSCTTDNLTNNLTDNVINNTNINAATNSVIEIAQGSRGRKIQEIDPDNLNVIKKIYPSMIYALRENSDYDKQSIQKAIKNNTIYKESRWLFVEHNQNPNIVNNIKETISSNQPEYNHIVKVNLEQTQIIQFLTGIGEMRSLYKIGNNKINQILENKLVFDNAYFIRVTDCPKNLLENYTLPIKNSKKAKSIKSTNIHNNQIEIYKSITELNIKTGITYKKIKDIIKDKKIVNECKWEYI
jgi:hypothetical protein